MSVYFKISFVIPYTDCINSELGTWKVISDRLSFPFVPLYGDVLADIAD